jgi:hypothetical protein
VHIYVYDLTMTHFQQQGPQTMIQWCDKHLLHNNYYYDTQLSRNDNALLNVNNMFINTSYKPKQNMFIDNISAINDVLFAS